MTLVILLPVIAGVLMLAEGATADPTINSKRAEAQRALDEINQMDVKLEKVEQQWDYERMRLQQTTKQLSRTKYSLHLARHSLDRARHALALRAIDVYQEQNADANSTVAILFQATSIQDMVNRVEAAQRISDHDADVVKQVTTLRNSTAAQAAKLQTIQSRQQTLVGQMAREKSSVESQIADRKAYVKKVKNEIASLVAEQEHQAELEREAAQRRIAAWKNYVPTPSEPTTADTNVATPPAGPSAIGNAVVEAAMTRLGHWYVWGASGPDTFDCSGLVVWSFAQAGMAGLPHYSYSLMGEGVPVSYDELEPGDLVFFYGGSHVGIYIGGGQFIHAPHTGTVVQVSSLAGYGGGLTAARRLGA